MRIETTKKMAVLESKRKIGLINMRVGWDNAKPCISHAYFDHKYIAVTEHDGLRLDKAGRVLCPVRLLSGRDLFLLSRFHTKG